MPAAGHPNVRTTLTPHGDETLLQVEAVDDDGNWANLLDADAAIAGADASGAPKTLHLAQVAPGRWEARFATPPPGAYPVTVALSRQRQPVWTDTAGLAVPYAPEYRPTGSNPHSPPTMSPQC